MYNNCRKGSEGRGRCYNRSKIKNLINFKNRPPIYR
jgi:hypothetical protein